MNELDLRLLALLELNSGIFNGKEHHTTSRKFYQQTCVHTCESVRQPLWPAFVIVSRTHEILGAVMYVMSATDNVTCRRTDDQYCCSCRDRLFRYWGP